MLSARSYTAEFNAEGLASGIYVYVLSVDGRQVSSNRMMLME